MFDNDLPPELGTTDLKNELEQYLNKEVDPNMKDMDILLWWKAHQHEFLLLNGHEFSYDSW